MRELMAVVGVAAGVALLFTVQVAHRSVTGSFREISQGVAGRATLELAARGPEGFNERVSAEVEHMPGVKAVAALLQQPVVAVGPKGRRALVLVGASEQIDALGGRLARAFQRAGERSTQGLLILTAPTAGAIGARPGQDVKLLVGERSEHLALDATVSSGEVGAAAATPIAASSLPIVQSLAALPGRITRVLIEPQPGREAALQGALAARFGARLNARPVETETKLLENAAGPEKQITLLFSAISLVAGILIAYNALLLASERRRQFILALIGQGAPDSLIVSSLAFDALILGLAGSLLGLLAGDAISLVAYRTIPGYIAAAFSIGGERVIDSQTILLTLAGGLFAALIAAGLPAISILRSSATAEPDSIGRTLSFTSKLRLADTAAFGFGTLLTAASVAAAVLAPATAVAALIGITLGLVLCLPTTLRVALQVAAAGARRSDQAPARLSVAELRVASRRSVAVLALGTIAAFLTVVISGSVANVKTAARNGAGALMSSADLWIKPGGPENVYTTQPFQYRQTQHDLEQLPAVHSVEVWRDSFLDLPGRRVWVLGVPPTQQAQIVPSQLLDGSLQVADRHLREGGWVALSAPIAREHHLRIGEQLTLPTPSGREPFRLAATIANYGWLPGAIVMNGNDHARLWNSQTASQLAVTLAPGVTIAQGKAAVQRALSPNSAVAVKSAGERRAEVSAVLGSTLSRLNDTTLVVLVATVTSVLALMISAIWQRRARLDELMAQGWSPLQFATLVSYETGAVLLTGCLIGIVAGLGGQALIDEWLKHTTGASVRYTPGWGIALRTLGIAAAISAFATLVALAQTAGFQPRAAFAND